MTAEVNGFCRRGWQKKRWVDKMIRGLGRFTYEERLMRCGLTNLEKRRTRGDLIEAYKIMTGKEAISAHRFFEVSLESRTWGHGYKLYKKRTGTRRNRFFSVRVVNPENELDEKTVTVDTVDKFKSKLSEFGYLDMEVVLTQTVVFWITLNYCYVMFYVTWYNKTWSHSD